MTAYTITAIKSDGQRELAFNRDSRNAYKTREEAEKAISDIIKNNSKERVDELIGKDLRVDPVTLRPTGEIIELYFH